MRLCFFGRGHMPNVEHFSLKWSAVDIENPSYNWDAFHQFIQCLHSVFVKYYVLIVLSVFVCLFVCFQAVLLISGHQTVARCVSATHTAAVMPSQGSAPATPTAGVRCASMPASVAGTVAATPFTETAHATRAGTRQAAPSHASVSVEHLWALAATSWLVSVSATGATGDRNVPALATATCRRVISEPVSVNAEKAGGDPPVTDGAIVISHTAAVTRSVGNVCATWDTRVSSATTLVKLGSMAVVAQWGRCKMGTLFFSMPVCSC